MSYKNKIKKLKECNLRLYYFLKKHKALKKALSYDFSFSKDVKLSEAFYWGRTKEGLFYWADLSHKYEDLTIEI